MSVCMYVINYCSSTREEDRAERGTPLLLCRACAELSVSAYWTLAALALSTFPSCTCSYSWSSKGLWITSTAFFITSVQVKSFASRKTRASAVQMWVLYSPLCLCFCGCHCWWHIPIVVHALLFHILLTGCMHPKCSLVLDFCPDMLSYVQYIHGISCRLLLLLLLSCVRGGGSG